MLQQLLAADGKCLVICGMEEGRVCECPGLVWAVPWLLHLHETRVSDGAKPFQGCVLQSRLRVRLHLFEADLFPLQLRADPRCSSAQAAARPAVALIPAP